ncbi:MAG: hypothetical protein AAGJ52_03390 [Pseudomonadota bacterium]
MNRRIKMALAGAAVAGSLFANPLSAAIKPGDYLNGQWATVPDGSRGITFTYIPNADGTGDLFGAVFSYDQAGDDAWVVFQVGFLEHQFESTGDIFAVQGGTFDNPPVPTTAADIGDATVTLNSCGSLEVAFDFADSAEFNDVTWDMQPLTTAVGGDVAQCAYEQEFAGCPSFATDTGFGLRECLVSGQFLDQEITLTNDTTWILDGLLEIGAPNTNSAVLNIEPGTVITSLPNTNNAFIFVHAGSEIFADGLPYAPIVITSAFDGFPDSPRAPQPGDTGGLAVAGLAPCNSAPGVELGCFSEFASGDQVLSYGGNDPADSSGSVSYFQIRYGGIVVGSDQEVNSFTFLGAGNGTNISHIQAYNSLDDGIEFFGGTANMRYGVFTDGADDSLDWDEGWSGKAQWGLIVINDEQGAGAGFEGANNGDAFDASPRATPIISNFTVVSQIAHDDDAFQLKEGSGGQIWNSIAVGYGGSCVNLRDQATLDAAGSPEAPTGALAFAGTIVNGCGSLFQSDSTPGFAESFFNSSAFPNNLTVDPMLGTDLMPMPGSPALGNGVRVFDLATGEPIEFFDFQRHSGAFDGKTNWTDGWTFDPYGTAR